VQQGNPVAEPPLPGIPVYDEFVFKNKYAIVPQFILTLRLRRSGKTVVWRNTTFQRYGNEAIFEQLRAEFRGIPMAAYDCDEDALHKVKKTMDKRCLFIVTNRRDGGERFLAACREAGVTTPMLVFCLRTEGWTPVPGVTITASLQGLRAFFAQVVHS
jgi:hypothetical protein